MKDIKLQHCVSSPWGFCLQADLQAFCSYLNRVEIRAEYWSVSSEGIWGQYHINLSRDCSGTLVYIWLSHLKEKRMHSHPSLPPSSNGNNLSKKGKKLSLRAAISLQPDLRKFLYNNDFKSKGVAPSNCQDTKQWPTWTIITFSLPITP